MHISISTHCLSQTKSVELAAILRRQSEPHNSVETEATPAMHHSIPNQNSIPWHTVIRSKRQGPHESDSDGILIYASMAAENAAKPTHPAPAACGPAFAPKIPPVMQPAVTLLVRSFFARSPSMQHSVPEYSAPTMAKFLAEENDRDPMSLKPRRTCSRHGRLEISWPWGVRGES